jgi:hypothetical protein
MFEIRRRNLVGQKVILATKRERMKLESLYRERVYNDETFAYSKDKIVIGYNKTKALVSTIFWWGILSSIFLKIKTEDIIEIQTWYMYLGALIFVSLIFLPGFSSFRKLINRKPALIISKIGIETKEGVIFKWEKIESLNINSGNETLEIEYYQDKENTELKSELIDFQLMNISKSRLISYIDVFYLTRNNDTCGNKS